MNYWFCGGYTLLEKSSKAVQMQIKSIDRSGDEQKWQDEKPIDPEEACKTWDCREFICHLVRLKTRNKCEKQIMVVLL